MVEMYYKLVLAHKRTCNPENKTVKMVPQTCLDDVLAMLEKLATTQMETRKMRKLALAAIFAVITTIFIKHRKDDLNMVEMYLALVIAGRRTCNKENTTVKHVPDRYIPAVTDELTALGLDADGNPA